MPYPSKKKKKTRFERNKSGSIIALLTYNVTILKLYYISLQNNARNVAGLLEIKNAKKKHNNEKLKIKKSRIVHFCANLFCCSLQLLAK